LRFPRVTKKAGAGAWCAKDVNEGMPDTPKQKNTEGQGWTHFSEVSKRNSHTGSGGTKRKD
jgi:hypothetical protein